jgi:hypothetical protein
MYTINSTEVKDEILIANVTYVLEDKTELTIDVDIFQPQNKEDVLQGIANREVSEQHKYDSQIAIEGIKEELDSDVVKQPMETIDGKATLSKVSLVDKKK